MLLIAGQPESTLVSRQALSAETHGLSIGEEKLSRVGFQARRLRALRALQVRRCAAAPSPGAHQRTTRLHLASLDPPVQKAGGCRRWHIFTFIADNGHIVFRWVNEHSGKAISTLLSGFRGHLLLTVYARLCICMYVLHDVFQTLADPTRRRIVEVLRAGEQQVGDVVAKAGIHQSGVSRHLRILSEAGFVSMRPDGQRRLYALKSEPFREIDEWLAQYRDLWEARLDRFGAALEKKQQTRVTPRSKKR